MNDENEILEEIYRIKREISAEYSSIHEMCEDLRRTQWDHGNRVVERVGDEWVEVPPPLGWVPPAERARNGSR